MRRTALALALVAAAATPAAAQQPTADQLPSVTLPPELARVLTDYENAYREGGDALALLFAPDGFVLPGGRPPVRGREAIAAYYGRGGTSLALRAIAYANGGTVAFIIGAYAAQQGTPDAGKFTLTLRKDVDGRWLIFSDMDNSNRRLQPGGAPSPR